MFFSAIKISLTSSFFLFLSGRGEHSLHGHLGHDVKRGEVGVGKVFLVLAHLDGIQPLVHSAEAGEVWDAAVQQREMNTEGEGEEGRRRVEEEDMSESR